MTNAASNFSISMIKRAYIHKRKTLAHVVGEVTASARSIYRGVRAKCLNHLVIFIFSDPLTYYSLFGVIPEKHKS